MFVRLLWISILLLSYKDNVKCGHIRKKKPLHDNNMSSLVDLPDILQQQLDIIQFKAREKLIKSIAQFETNPFYMDSPDISDSQKYWLGQPFEDVVVALPLSKDLIHSSDGKGGEEKFFVAPDALRLTGSDFIVYGAGINKNANFELYLASLGASVFAFDCTVLEPMKEWWSIKFYSW